MADTSQPAGVERPSDFESTTAYWESELSAAERVTERWRKDAARICDRYALEKESEEENVYTDRLLGGFNVLHSNIETMKPAIFGRAPVPYVFRRHADRDPIGRVAAEVLERALKTELEDDDAEPAFKAVTQDLLLTGRGVPWLVYEPTIVQVPTGELDQEGQPVTMPRLVDAHTRIEYVQWSEFLHSPKSTWAEVKRTGWVARSIPMTRDQGIKRFGEIFEKVPLGEFAPGVDQANLDDEKKEVIGQARVWEIWDAFRKRTIWLCRGYQERTLEERDDPLGLDGFFPCPMPAFGTKDNRRLVPVPDYLQYEKLANELDNQTRRISILTRALRAAGAYDGTLEGIGTLLDNEEDSENVLVPIKEWAALDGKALENHIAWLPMKQIAETLIGLYDARDRTKQTLYEVSGLADIMRGQVDPREKLGQSRLKGQFASQRLQDKIRTMETCARDTLAIKAEIMAEHYPADLLRNLSGFDYMPDVERLRNREPTEPGAPSGEYMVDVLWQKVIELLKDEKRRGFRIDVETNSTVLVDDDEEKQRRIEAVEAVGALIERSMPLVVQVPEALPLVSEMMTFLARGFRGGRQLEGAIEQFTDRIAGVIEQSQQQEQEQQGPTPEEQAAQAHAEGQIAVTQAKTQEAVVKSQAAQQTAQANALASAVAAQADMANTRSKIRARVEEAQIDAALSAADIETRLEELGIERGRLELRRQELRQEALETLTEGDDNDD